MSQQNAEIVRGVFDAYFRGDMRRRFPRNGVISALSVGEPTFIA
jgi:hypothetical protein